MTHTHKILQHTQHIIRCDTACLINSLLPRSHKTTFSCTAPIFSLAIEPTTYHEAHFLCRLSPLDQPNLGLFDIFVVLRIFRLYRPKQQWSFHGVHPQWHVQGPMAKDEGCRKEQEQGQEPGSQWCVHTQVAIARI